MNISEQETRDSYTLDEFNFTVSDMKVKVYIDIKLFSVQTILQELVKSADLLLFF
jgi:hypothetical protein